MPTAMIDEELLRAMGVLPPLKNQKPPSPQKPAPPPALGPDGQPVPVKDTQPKPLVFTPRKPPDAKSMMKALEHRKIVEAEHEAQHWVSCGKQVTSKRATRPVFSFGPPCKDGKKGYFKDPRARELNQHPSTRNPGPEYNMQKDVSPTSVLRGFGTEKRFLDDSASPRLVQQGKNVVGDKGQTDKPIQIVHSTGASIFSATYPYQEPPTIDGSPEEKEKAKKNLEKLGVSLRSAAVTDPELNHQKVKYRSIQKYSFGSSCIGHRFPPGVKISKGPTNVQHAPRISFRDQRLLVAQPVLKDPPAPAEPPAPAPAPEG